MKQTPISHQQKTRLLIASLVILFFVLCLGRIYSTNPTKSNSQIREGTISIVDPTTNWKIYTNLKYGYTVKYPSDWTEEAKCDGGVAQDDYMCFKSADLKVSDIGPAMGTVKGGLVWIDSRRFLVGLPSKDFCNPPANQGIPQLQSCTETTINDLDVMKRRFGNQLQVGIMKNGKVVISFVAMFNPSSEKEISDLSNQMLSTFQFTNQTSQVDTSNWQTYINRKGKYSYRYPPEWNIVTNKIREDQSLFGPKTSDRSGLGGVELWTLKNGMTVGQFLQGIGSANYTNKSAIAVDGITGIRQQYNDVLSGEQVVLLKNGTLYNIYIGSLSQNEVKLFNGLISTFRFIQ